MNSFLVLLHFLPLVVIFGHFWPFFGCFRPPSVAQSLPKVPIWTLILRCILLLWLWAKNRLCPWILSCFVAFSTSGSHFWHFLAVLGPPRWPPCLPKVPIWNRIPRYIICLWHFAKNRPYLWILSCFVAFSTSGSHFWPFLAIFWRF